VNKKICLISVMLMLIAAMLSPSCYSSAKIGSTAAASPKSEGANPVIAIDYSGTFKGQTASGSLNLVVDLTIENIGYQAFNTSPERFSVSVDNYFYHPSESSLLMFDLPAGEKTNGKLVFQVPPVAATTRVGYQMEHSAQGTHNIQWSKREVSPGESAASTPEVSITFSDSLMWIKETKSLYLLVELYIENKGYESFNTSPEYFTLVMGNILGETTPRPPISFDGVISDQKDGAFSDLRSYDLQNGGKLTGTLAFRVPPEIQATTERYSLEYAGVRTYNIKWTWKPPLPDSQ
jgi:hypothetical protein